MPLGAGCAGGATVVVAEVFALPVVVVLVLLELVVLPVAVGLVVVVTAGDVVPVPVSVLVVVVAPGGVNEPRDDPGALRFAPVTRPRVAAGATGGAPATPTLPLRALSPPVQFCCTGVSVYTHEPDGTLPSVHVVVVTTPLQPGPTVAGAPVAAS